MRLRVFASGAVRSFGSAGLPLWQGNALRCPCRPAPHNATHSPAPAADPGGPRPKSIGHPQPACRPLMAYLNGLNAINPMYDRTMAAMPTAANSRGLTCRCSGPSAMNPGGGEYPLGDPLWCSVCRVGMWSFKPEVDAFA